MGGKGAPPSVCFLCCCSGEGRGGGGTPRGPRELRGATSTLYMVNGVAGELDDEHLQQGRTNAVGKRGKAHVKGEACE